LPIFCAWKISEEQNAFERRIISGIWLVGFNNSFSQIVREMAGITQPLHPHLFHHQMLTYLTSKGLTDTQIQLISGHESKKSLEVYQHLSLESVDKAYQDAVQSVGI